MGSPVTYKLTFGKPPIPNESYDYFTACLDAIKQSNVPLAIQTYNELDRYTKYNDKHYIASLTTFIFASTNEELVNAFLVNDNFDHYLAISGIAKYGNIDRFIRFLEHTAPLINAHVRTEYIFDYIFDCIDYCPNIATQMLLAGYGNLLTEHDMLIILNRAVSLRHIDTIHACLTSIKVLAHSRRLLYGPLCKLKQYDLAIQIVTNDFENRDWELCYNIAQNLRAYPVMLYILRNSMRTLHLLRPRLRLSPNLQVLASLYRGKYITKEECEKTIKNVKEWGYIAKNVVLLQSKFNVPGDVLTIIRTFLY